MKNEYDPAVESCDRKSSYAWLRVGRHRLAARRWAGIAPGARVTVRIRPEDVILSRNAPGQVSARNVLPGHAVGLRLAPEGAYVALDVGIPLTAIITPEAAGELRIRRGVPLFAILKASAVVPVVHDRSQVRVTFVGARGDLDARKMDFLRALAGAGSLSSAARELGINYRTAWMWAQSINRAWGTRLIGREHGGRGGGGTSISPEGRALLERARSLEAAANSPDGSGRSPGSPVRRR